jgi:DNA processing protein
VAQQNHCPIPSAPYLSYEMTANACKDCLRRSWLLSDLSRLLDYKRSDLTKLQGLLDLDDEALIQAIAGRRREALQEEWERFEVDELQLGPTVESTCEHSPGYPPALRDRRASRMLYVVPNCERLCELIAKPAVAIVGSQKPTDYGFEMARSLARGIAASGVTVVSGLANGIAAAAHAGALDVDGPTVTVMAGGVDVISPAGRRELYERVTAGGCALATLPCGFYPQRWCEPARALTIAGLTRLTIVVEADDDPYELFGARAARALGQTFAALPGPVTSPASRGTNKLLMEDARMVRGPADALDLLYTLSEPGTYECKPTPPAPPELEPRLQTVLEQVGAGFNTLGKLTSATDDEGETLLALTELELMGLLTRGDGGRYVPRQSLAE